jgi:hypothetical protein
MTDRSALREQLVMMRERLIDSLGDQIEGGYLARLNEVQGAIAAIDAETLGTPLAHVLAEGCDDARQVVSPHSTPPLRAIVRDEPRRAVELQSTTPGASLPPCRCRPIGLSPWRPI